MRQPRYFSKDLYYHLLSRGNNQDLFVQEGDFSKYQFYLEKCVEKFGIKLLAFVLMPNHIHLLAGQNSENSISKFMQVLSTSYSTYFNAKHKRKGHLFEGRFKHISVDTDEYLVHLSRYIHLNPSSSKLVSKPEDYKWGSYRAYLNLSNLKFVNTNIVLEYFDSKSPRGDYRNFVNSRVKYQQEISFQKLTLE